jgi:hypothetical protein
MATSITSEVNKKVEINGIQQIVAFNWYPVGEKYNEKSYMKKTKWGTYKQSEYMRNCIFQINEKEYNLETLFVELAAGGYARYFIVDGIKFNDSHKKVIEFLLNK